MTPPVYCTYLAKRTPAGTRRPGDAGVRGKSQLRWSRRHAAYLPGALPPLPTHLRRILNAGNEIEVLAYPTLGDRIHIQSKYLDIVERRGKDGSPMLLVTIEEIYTKESASVLCTLKFSLIYR